MKKLYPLVALAIVLAIAGLYGLEHFQKLRERQQAQTAHLITRCVNQGLLSLFTLQSTDWSKGGGQLKTEEERLKQRVAALPEAVLDGKPFADWQGALEVCERLTVNSNRQHKTIFRPLTEMANKDIWNLETAKSEQFQERRKRAIYRTKIAAEAADRYLDDLQADVDRLLTVSGLSEEARALTAQQLQVSIFDEYHKGRFSKRRVLQYLDRQEAFYQLLTDNPKGFTLRGGSLYFYNKDLHRQADDLNRALLQGEVDFFANWRQLVQQ
ncbi:hypothetical protein [Microbulbifer sp. ALW1]|uniref:hypothetical protein n=1 Tax=Microbulbifer sp. (strain ALW1) TaxID=1516059 RepID=UPI001359F613|nr:hypothetical protein [Microbulbifer sp. ALW1]